MSKLVTKKLAKLLAVDPSLTCSGWALFEIQNSRLLGVGKIKSRAASEPLFERLSDLQNKIEAVLNGLRLDPGDIVVCEAPTTMRDPNAAIKVEQVRGLFEAVARSKGLLVPGRINPRTVQYEIMGLGGRQLARVTVKAAAQQVVETLFGLELRRLGVPCGAQLKKHQDIVDALLVGSVALSRLQTGARTGSQLVQMFEGRRRERRAWALKQRKG